MKYHNIVCQLTIVLLPGFPKSMFHRVATVPNGNFQSWMTQPLSEACEWLIRQRVIKMKKCIIDNDAFIESQLTIKGRWLMFRDFLDRNK